MGCQHHLGTCGTQGCEVESRSLSHSALSRALSAPFVSGTMSFRTSPQANYPPTEFEGFQAATGQPYCILLRCQITAQVGISWFCNSIFPLKCLYVGEFGGWDELC